MSENAHMMVAHIYLLSDGMTIKLERLNGNKSIHSIKHIKSLGNENMKAVLHQMKNKVDAQLFKKYMIVGISSDLDKGHFVDVFFLDRDVVEVMPSGSQDILRCIL